MCFLVGHKGLKLQCSGFGHLLRKYAIWSPVWLFIATFASRQKAVVVKSNNEASSTQAAFPSSSTVTAWSPHLNVGLIDTYGLVHDRYHLFSLRETLYVLLAN